MNTIANLFIDESGKSSLADESSPHFLMTGVIINSNDITTIEGFFNYIKLKYSLPINLPFHSYHLYEHPTLKVGDKTAIELSRTLAEFISLIPIEMHLVVIDKTEFKKALGIINSDDFKGSKERKELKDFPYRIMATCLFGWFANYLKKNNLTGQIIADSRRGGDHQLLKSLHLCKEGSVPLKTGFKELIDEKIRAITFAEKHLLSGGLELTDLVSYISFFRIRRVLTNYKHLGFDLIWKEINSKGIFSRLEIDDVKRFFKLKEGEVHKYLKT